MSSLAAWWQAVASGGAPAAPTGLLGYPLDFWAELVRSSSQTVLTPAADGDFVWLRTSDGEPLEQEQSADGSDGSWVGVFGDNDEPDLIGSYIPDPDGNPTFFPSDFWRARKLHLPWLPSDDGLQFTTIVWTSNGVFRFFSADRPGTLTHGVTRRQGGGVDIAAVIEDPDGITSVDAATVLATDGRQNDISERWVRRDANSFTHADQRTGNRWRTASMSVTYTDGNGVQATLTDSWDV